jgi:phosphate acyltransferase
MIARSIRDRVPTNPALKPLFWPVRYATSTLRKQMDYAEIGGSPLLGLNGVCVIGHGRSNEKAIKNAILMAQQAIDNNLVDTIRESMKREVGVPDA